MEDKMATGLRRAAMLAAISMIVSACGASNSSETAAEDMTGPTMQDMAPAEPAPSDPGQGQAPQGNGSSTPAEGSEDQHISYIEMKDFLNRLLDAGAEEFRQTTVEDIFDAGVIDLIVEYGLIDEDSDTPTAAGLPTGTLTAEEAAQWEARADAVASVIEAELARYGPISEVLESAGSYTSPQIPVFAATVVDLFEIDVNFYRTMLDIRDEQGTLALLGAESMEKLFTWLYSESTNEASVAVVEAFILVQGDLAGELATLVNLAVAGLGLAL